MIFKKNKCKFCTFALVLMLVFSVFVLCIGSVAAHDPPQNIKTFAYVSAAPNPIGVNQNVIIYMWLDKAPPTASGSYGDRWEGFTLTITKPDGSAETQGPFTSDPVGFSWLIYTPSEVGVYNLKFEFPGQVLAGNNLDPFDFFGGSEYIGDYYEPSEDEVSFTVQQEQVEPYPDSEMPTGAWTRPINPENRNWWAFSGNWLATPENHHAKYTEGPKTAHILWAKPLTFGGLVGGELADSSYHDGDAYEGKWFPPVIINGVLYYNKYPSNFNIPGYYAVDLRTGKEIYYNNNTLITIGQLYDYNSMNQHGTFAYLWSITSGGFFGSGPATWECYDAFSGDYWYTITDGPSAPFAFTSTPQMVYGNDGSILIQSIDPINHRLLVWNSSAIVDLYGGLTGSNYWQWRPYGKTVSGADAYSVNVSIPADVNGSISFVFDDMLIVSDGLGMGGGGFTFIETEHFTVWALSLKSGEEGKLLWKQTYTTIPDQTSGVTLNMGPASIEDGVFTIRSSQTMEWWGFSLADGSYMWGPTEPQVAWDSLVGTQGYIAYGNLYAGGYGGVLYCYDITNGNLKWTYRLADDYYMEAKWGGNYNIGNMLIADGKIYIFSGEHSPDDPKERGSLIRCVDAYSGDEIWTFPFYDPNWAVNPAIADGILVHFNAYDNRIYAFGKGESATTIEAPMTAVQAGTHVILSGTVTDQSTGSKGTPAISDEDMSAWMKYLYLQQPIPTNAKGVAVKLTAINENGDSENIGTVTSDTFGQFSTMWAPSAEGQYTIIATFEGSDAYYGSSAQTTLGVIATSNSQQSTSTLDISTLQTSVYVLIIIVIIAVIVLALIVTRKRK